MAPRDVILTVYACSYAAPCNQWAKEFFEDEPIVLNVPGSGGASFRAKAVAWGKTGDLFKAAVKELAPHLGDVEIGRRGLVTFSVGWAFADELLKFEKEKNRLDAYLLLDGCHTNDLTNWQDYAIRCANLEAFMAMAHSSIKPPFVSTTVTNSTMFKKACDANEHNMSVPKLTFDPPDYVIQAILPTPVTIKLGASPGMKASSKTWTTDPLIKFENRGDLTRIHYSGEGPCDHVYVSWYVSKRLWQWLGESWRNPYKDL